MIVAGLALLAGSPVPPWSAPELGISTALAEVSLDLGPAMDALWVQLTGVVQQAMPVLGGILALAIGVPLVMFLFNAVTGKRG